MGEKIKDIGKIHLGSTDLDVELNHGTRQNEKLEVMRNNVEYGQKVIRLLEEDADYFMYVKIYSNITFVKNEYKEQIYSL